MRSGSQRDRGVVADASKTQTKSEERTTLTADQPTRDELEQMRRLTQQVRQERAERKGEVAEYKETKQFNKDAQTIPCQFCHRTAIEVMAARREKMKEEGEYGLGRFEEKDGKTIFTCIECRQMSPV